MPNFDNTGPQGQGPQTGRGQGNCRSGINNGPGNAQGGLGRGRRGGCRANGGQGRGGRGNGGGRSW